MSTRIHRIGRGAVAAAVVALFAACAGPNDQTVSSMAVARTSLRQAESDNAATLAPVDYRNARDKMVRAEDALRDKRYTEARTFADESAADSDVADRKAKAVKAETIAADQRRANAALDAQLNRPAAVTTTTQTTTATPVVIVPTPDANAVVTGSQTKRTTTTVTTSP